MRLKKRVTSFLITVEDRVELAPSGIITPMAMELTGQAKNLSIPERIRLVEEIWDTIAAENEAFELTDAQKRELDRRLEWARTILAKAGHGMRLKRNS